MRYSWPSLGGKVRSDGLAVFLIVFWPTDSLAHPKKDARFGAFYSGVLRLAGVGWGQSDCENT